MTQPLCATSPPGKPLGSQGRPQTTNRGWLEEEIHRKHQRNTALTAASSAVRCDAKLCDNMKAISCRHSSLWAFTQITQTTTLLYLLGCSQGWRSSSSLWQRPSQSNFLCQYSVPFSPSWPRTKVRNVSIKNTTENNTSPSKMLVQHNTIFW